MSKSKVIKPISEKEFEKKVDKYADKHKMNFLKENLDPIIKDIVNKKAWQEITKDETVATKCTNIIERDGLLAKQIQEKPTLSKSDQAKFQSLIYKRRFAVMVEEIAAHPQEFTDFKQSSRKGFSL